MTVLNFVAELKVSEEFADELRDCDVGYIMGNLYESLDELQLSDLKGCDEGYLGLMAVLFVSPFSFFGRESVEEEHRNTISELYNTPNRAFVDGVSVHPDEDTVVVYYRANHGAEEDFWKRVTKVSSHVSEVDIHVDPEYPEDEEEMGKDWSLHIEMSINKVSKFVCHQIQATGNGISKDTVDVVLSFTEPYLKVDEFIKFITEEEARLEALRKEEEKRLALERLSEAQKAFEEFFDYIGYDIVSKKLIGGFMVSMQGAGFDMDRIKDTLCSLESDDYLSMEEFCEEGGSLFSSVYNVLPGYVNCGRDEELRCRAADAFEWLMLEVGYELEELEGLVEKMPTD